MPLYVPSSSEVGGGVLLASYDFSGSESTYTFSNIPQTFTHLRLVCDLRSSRAVAGAAAFFRFNGDTTAANYNMQRVASNSTTVTGVGAIGTDAGAYNDIVGASAPANDGTTIDAIMPFYRSGRIKKMIAHASHRTSAEATNHVWYQPAWFWLNTAAITSITVVESTGANFDSSSRIRLYGNL